MSENSNMCFQDAIEHISKSDSLMSELIAKIGECTLERNENYYVTLLSSIINQQLSGSAADSIYKRLLGEVGGELSPSNVFSLYPQQFRRAGVSKAKEEYIRRLSFEFITNENFLSKLEEKTDSEVLSILTNLKGVGKWTAEMFMIFGLNRLDILPMGDSGFRRAVSKFYNGGIPATDDDIINISDKWRPYRSVAVWYLWRGIDTVPKGPIQSQRNKLI